MPRLRTPGLEALATETLAQLHYADRLALAGLPATVRNETHPEIEARPMPSPARFRHQPFYCEENAWWLCADPTLGDGPRHVLFITSHEGICPFAAQQAAAPGEVVWWDYHCVVLDGAARIWDLDSRLDLPLPGADWLARTFPFAHLPAPQLLPRFRIIPGDDYRRRFASDRSHMRTDNGSWQQPPPPWAPIGSGMNLARYRDTTRAGPPGRLLDLKAFSSLLADRRTTDRRNCRADGPSSMDSPDKKSLPS